MLGANGVPLHHVIRKVAPVSHQFANPAESLICEAPLLGLAHTEDNRKVCGIIKQLVADTQNWDWIKGLNRAWDGRGAMTLLRTHFDGPGEVEKRIAHARNAMEGLHYTKESVFPFSSHVTGLNTCHATLAQAFDPASDRNKVQKVPQGTTTQNPSLIAAMQSIRSNPGTKSNFAAASNKLSEQIALMFPGEARRPAHHGRCIAGQGSGNRNRRRGGRGRGRGRRRGGRGCGGATVADGVDISRH
jgi:hypothetical protein